MPAFYTRKGDDGYTGLLGDERVPKYHPRPSSYGALDEASAALGLARALTENEETRLLLIEIQRDLYKIMAEVAATQEQADRFRSIDADRLAWLEAQVNELGAHVEMPKGFVIPGDTLCGAALDSARTIVRRAERSIAELAHSGELGNQQILSYINRLSTLCFMLMLREYSEGGVHSPTMAKPKGS